jgi:hypothetical protein
MARTKQTANRAFIAATAEIKALKAQLEAQAAPTDAAPTDDDTSDDDFVAPSAGKKKKKRTKAPPKESDNSSDDEDEGDGIYDMLIDGAGNEYDDEIEVTELCLTLCLS